MTGGTVTSSNPPRKTSSSGALPGELEDSERPLLGQILMARHGLSEANLERALAFQATYGGRIGTLLVNMGLITEDALVAALSEQLAVPRYEETPWAEDNDGLPEPPGELNPGFLAEHKWILLQVKDKHLHFAALDPLDVEVHQYLRDLGFSWTAHPAAEAAFRELQGRYDYQRDSLAAKELSNLDLSEAEVDKLLELASEAPVVNLVNRLIARAVVSGASDLHLEPFRNMVRVRFRIDGLLHDMDFLPGSLQLPVASRIKILAGLDIAERRRPQDGQITTKVASKDLDIRVSTLPLAEGESIVLRFLLKDALTYNLQSLGLEEDLVCALQEDISRTAGVILLTGPTGSGKTTTLYSCLNAINTQDKKIVTIEDPVEYRLEGINQIQVHPEIGYDFLSALRSILRQDPDVIMIGEIRDSETARTAMQSSLTGHLVFSTLHTNDAPSTFTRLIDLGLQEYLINSSIISVIAQRLVRKLCDRCAEPDEEASAVLKSYDLFELAERHALNRVQPRRPVGCPHCNHTGYRGRVGIMEYLRCTEDIKSSPKDASFPQRARAYMAGNNIRSLREDGFVKYLKGVTSVEEVLRVAG
jgi:general secretion pathway protein E